MLDLVGNAEYRFSRKSARILTYKFHSIIIGERTGLVVRASDSGSGDPGFDPRPGRCVVSLSKRHLLPKSTGNTQE